MLLYVPVCKLNKYSRSTYFLKKNVFNVMSVECYDIFGILCLFFKFLVILIFVCSF